MRLRLSNPVSLRNTFEDYPLGACGVVLCCSRRVRIRIECLVSSKVLTAPDFRLVPPGDCEALGRYLLGIVLRVLCCC